MERRVCGVQGVARMDVGPKSTEMPAALVSLSTLFWMFFKIACTSFGGYMAMISVVEREVVARRRLMRHEDMLDGISLASILPGPVAVNLVVYVGYRLRGGAGALALEEGGGLDGLLARDRGVGLGGGPRGHGRLGRAGERLVGGVPHGRQRGRAPGPLGQR